MRLKDKHILITGSATGIGAAIARRFTDEGARILVHGLDFPAAQRVAVTLGGAVACAADLSDPTAPAQIIEIAQGAFGRLDGIVNNAAFIPRTNLLTTDPALFDRCMAVNVRAPMLLVQAANDLLKSAGGSVLNIGSVNAYCGEPNLLPYSVSKGALMTLTRNLSDALGRDRIRVNQLNLGWVLSESEDNLQQAMGKPKGWHLQLPKSFAPAGRILMPEEVAAAAVYWMSDESQLISGTVMELEQFPVVGRNPAKEIG